MVKLIALYRQPPCIDNEITGIGSVEAWSRPLIVGVGVDPVHDGVCLWLVRLPANYAGNGYGSGFAVDAEVKDVSGGSVTSPQ